MSLSPIPKEDAPANEVEMAREPVTPWNPSRRAIARVKNPIPVPHRCPHCGCDCNIVSNAEVYNGREYGEWPWCVLCVGCGAYVGLHPFTGIPLGTLATPEIREARKRAKAAFNPLWESKAMTRDAAYAWLAGAMGSTNIDECHVGWFDVQQCNRVVNLVKARKR